MLQTLIKINDRDIWRRTLLLRKIEEHYHPPGISARQSTSSDVPSLLDSISSRSLAWFTHALFIQHHSSRSRRRLWLSISCLSPKILLPDFTYGHTGACTRALHESKSRNAGVKVPEANFLLLTCSSPWCPYRTIILCSILATITVTTTSPSHSGICFAPFLCSRINLGLLRHLNFYIMFDLPTWLRRYTLLTRCMPRYQA